MLSEQQQRIMGYFIEEAKDHLNTIEQGLLNLQSTIEDSELASEMFRAAHSVKGGAAMLGLNSIQTASHRLEDYFKVLKECSIKVDQRLETLLLEVFDVLKELLEQLQGPFGLTEEKATEVMAGVQHTFVELNNHLSALVAQSGATPPDDVELTVTPVPVPVSAAKPTAQPVVSEESALQLIFQSDVPARLRDMLQLFKQGDTAGTRQHLQNLCRSLNQLGQQFEIHGWGDLLDLAERAIAHTDNSFRTLAPIVIRDIKQAQERVLASRSGDIAASDALLNLLPPLNDFFPDLDLNSDLALEDITTASGSIDFDQVVEQPLIEEADISAIATPEPTEDLNWFSESTVEPSADAFSTVIQSFDSDESVESTPAPEIATPDISESFDLDFTSTSGVSHPSRNGSEMGMAELNSLADLFESDTPDMAISWQEEEVLLDAETGLPEPLELDNVSDFSDLLFGQEELNDLELQPSNAMQDDEDLSGLLNNAEGEMRRESVSINPFDMAPDAFDMAPDALGSEFNDLDMSLFDVEPSESVADELLFSGSVAGEPNEELEALGNFFADLNGETELTTLQSRDESSEPSSESPFELESPFGLDELPSESPLDLSLDEGLSDFENAFSDFDLADQGTVEISGDRQFIPDLSAELESLENLSDLQESSLEESSSDDFAFLGQEEALTTEPRSWMDALDDEDGLSSLPAAPALWDSGDSEDVTADLWGDPTAAAIGLPMIPDSQDLTHPPERSIDTSIVEPLTSTPLGSDALELDPNVLELNEEDAAFDFDFDAGLMSESTLDELVETDAIDGMTAAFTDSQLEELQTVDLNIEELQIPPDLAADLPSDNPFMMADGLDAFLPDDLLLSESALSELNPSEFLFLESDLFEPEPVVSDPNPDTVSLDFSASFGETLSGLEDLDPALAETDLFASSETDLFASVGEVDEALDLDAELAPEITAGISTSQLTDAVETDELFGAIEDIDDLLAVGANPDTQLSAAIAPSDDDLLNLDFLDFSSGDIISGDITNDGLSSDSETLPALFDDPEESDAFADLDELISQELFVDTEPSNPSSVNDDFADLEAFLNNESQSDGAFENSLSQTPESWGEEESQHSADSAIASFATGDSTEALPADNDTELNDLLSEFSDNASLGNAAPGFDSFADLGLSLDLDEPDIDEIFETEPLSSSGFSQTDFSASSANEIDDFSDLEALLGDEFQAEQPTSPPVVEPANEFEDLERLLENADQTLGGSPTVRGVRNSGASTNRRPNRRNPTSLADQTMRVSVKNLDGLNNLVGELVVNRNSLEQAEERLRQFLDNLLHQVQQLSDVGQRMRDLYERSLLESSLLSSRKSYQLPSSTNSTPAIAPGNHSTGVSFDALEMDRFTGFHTLSQEMIELIVRVRESSSDIEFVVEETDQITRNFRQITTQLQEGLTRARMVPFGQTADRLPRAVRDISVRCGKQAELSVEGRETLIDKMILEQLYDPMTHLVNNAITHGIEFPDERAAMGKPAMGRITVRTFHQGNQTVISVSDDGAGIDPDRVKAKALEKGLITPEEARTMTRLDVYDLLFHHGFSTRDKADDLAGRGVGLDVVRTSLNEIRGVVNIDSSVGRGTTFTIRLPLTLSISKALSCISNRSRIAFPMDGVEDMLDVPRERIQTNEEGQSCIQWRDQLLPFQPLSDLLKHGRRLGRGSVYGGNQEEDIVSVVVLRSNAGSYIALQVDQVLGEQEIVIKQLEGPVPKPLGIAGATVLGDGRIMPIADVLELIDLSLGRIRREVGSLLWDKGEEVPVEPLVVKTDPTVLIVDDSITVRELLSMTFAKIGFRVEQARDGQEAWEKLRSGLPCDIVFCDIEMPRMDGLELLSRLQKDPALHQIPIAMLTSRGADRHRQMAVQLGAKGYFTKPYLEEALLDAAQRMLKGEVLVVN